MCPDYHYNDCDMSNCISRSQVTAADVWQLSTESAQMLTFPALGLRLPPGNCEGAECSAMKISIFQY